MAVSDRLLITSDLEPKSALEFLARIIGISGEVEAMEGNSLVSSFSITSQWWTAYAVGTKFYGPESLIRTQLHLNPTVEIRFRFGNSIDGLAVRIDLLKAVLEVIAQKDWDIALTHADSKVILLRLAGQLTLKKDDPFWTSELLKAVTQPYTMENIPEL
jgi:hypothetical protein